MTEMNEKVDEANVPREPWQRLLEDDGDGPPETTDARIRANARRDLAPRGQRWWLPASLAASFVLAVLIVRSEIGTGGRIPIADAARGGNEAMDARIIDRNEGEQAREPGQAPAAASRRTDKQREEAESDEYGYQDSELGTEAAGTGPLVGGPERELKAASENPEERDLRIDLPDGAAEPPNAAAGMLAAAPPVPAPAAPASKAAVAKEGKGLSEVVVTGSRQRESEQGTPVTSSWTPTHVAAPVDNAQPTADAGVTAPPTPEAWYAAIEKLRREGRIAEADRELARLKKAYPAWLEEHLKQQQKPQKTP
jgi:hypothetical protein